MNIKHICAALVISMVSTAGIAATINSLNKQELNNIISDKTISTVPVITMDNQLTQNSITVYFGKDGKITGKLTNQPANGPQNDTGTWKIEANGALCVTWQHLNNATPICVTAFKVANGLILINDKNHGFETVLLSGDIKAGNQVN